MNIILDMDGVLITRSEEIFAEILKSNHSICVKDYVKKTLMNGEKTTKNFSEEENKALFRAYIGAIKGASRTDVLSNIEKIKLLNERIDIDIHLISNTPEDIGSYFISEFSLEDCFSKIVFDAMKFGNKKCEQS